MQFVTYTYALYNRQLISLGGRKFVLIQKLLAPVLVAMLLGACSTDDLVQPKRSTHGWNELTELMEELPFERINDQFVHSGVKNLRSGNYISATKDFNRALKFDPTNANLHFLNGLTYHLRAETGDTSQYDFAKAGYDLALQYDPGNYWAAYLQGHIMLREQKFRRSQDAFAYALLHAPDNVAVLKALATASYFAQDLEVALSAITRVAELSPDDHDVVFNQVIINAASGRFFDAEEALAAYRDDDHKRTEFKVALLDKRIGDWQRLHDQRGYFLQTQFSTDSSDSDANDGLDTLDDITNNSESNDEIGPVSDSSDDVASAKATSKMVLVDVVIVRSEERHSTDKGVNLLSGLTATLGGTTLAYNQTNYLRGAGPSTASLVWAPTLSIASSAYALNIFNDNYDRNEVLARPTLVAEDGKRSGFFSGAVWHVELDGTSGSEGTVTDVPVGIKLEVTPTFRTDDRVGLNISASREFIEGRSANANFTNFAQTSRTEIVANVTLKFNDTLVLSGLSEKETERLNDGVPFLQDLPVIQYLFSHEDTLDYTKSIIILLTPREPRFTHADGTEKIEPGLDQKVAQPNLKELEARNGLFRPEPNIDAVFQHLQNGAFFKEFRQGDVTVESWSDPDRLERILMSTLQFLYY